MSFLMQNNKVRRPVENHKIASVTGLETTRPEGLLPTQESAERGLIDLQAIILGQHTGIELEQPAHGVKRVIHI